MLFVFKAFSCWPGHTFIELHLTQSMLQVGGSGVSFTISAKGLCSRQRNTKSWQQIGKMLKWLIPHSMMRGCGQERSLRRGHLKGDQWWSEVGAHKCWQVLLRRNCKYKWYRPVLEHAERVVTDKGKEGTEDMWVREMRMGWRPQTPKNLWRGAPEWANGWVTGMGFRIRFLRRCSGLWWILGMVPYVRGEVWEGKSLLELRNQESWETRG